MDSWLACSKPLHLYKNMYRLSDAQSEIMENRVVVVPNDMHRTCISDGVCIQALCTWSSSSQCIEVGPQNAYLALLEASG